ncbi:MAG TPA: hypothetical protein VL068_05135, partial [Microthrixaceae bacterium]|nr:hypothetical protein [Microthrixaceae bacterium]
MNAQRATRFLRGVTSLATLLALVIGVPLMLATWVGWPLPSTIPSLDSLGEAARSGISDLVVINTLAVIAWIAWAQITLSLVAEVVAVARGRRTISLPVLPG